jgi:hypothetical protein
MSAALKVSLSGYDCQVVSTKYRTHIIKICQSTIVYIYLYVFPVGKLKYRAVRFKNERVTAQAIERQERRRGIEELWKLAEIYRGDWKRRTEDVNAQSELLKQWLMEM